MTKTVLESDSFLVCILVMGIGCVLAMLYSAVNGDIALAAMLLGVVLMAFGATMLILWGLSKLLERLLGNRP